MRITGGVARGRLLRAPRGLRVRPTADKVRGAIFNLLAARTEITGANWLDLFCGSGAVALEALSRGAAHVTLIDESRDSCRVARQNLERAGFAEQADVRRLSLPRGLRILERSGVRFHGAFVDPPYRRGLSQVTLEALAGGELLCPGALVVVEHAAEESFEESYGGLRRGALRQYGSTGVSLYVNAEEK
jgi:16S rRNA (guanine966-N2)-methyltransferase